MRRVLYSVPGAKLLSWVLILCFSASFALAQQNAAPNLGAPNPAAPARPVAASRLITLDVSVTNQSGQAVPGLQQQDFTILDDNQPQKIVSFQAESSATANPPARVILVFDEVNTSYQHVTIARQEAEKFLSQNGGDLPWPTSLVFFSISGVTETTPTRDGKSLVKELKDNSHPLPNANRAEGIDGAVQRFNQSIRTLGQIAGFEASKPGRKVVIWIGPGWLFLSTTRLDLTVKDQQGLFRTIVSLSDGLRQARITLYNVDPSGSGSVTRDYYKSFLKGITTAKKVQGGELGLQVLAVQSGGLVFNSSNDLAAEMATCAADATSFYTLSFEGAVGDGPDEYHALEVKVDKPGLTARTNSGYYAQPARPSAH
jgi:VWFA-related protein